MDSEIKDEKLFYWNILNANQLFSLIKIYIALRCQS